MEKQTHVLSRDELQQSLGMKGFFGRMVAGIVYRFLELQKVNDAHKKWAAYDGPEFSEHILEEVGVKYEIPPSQLDYIPREGGFFTISNHHFGSIDGMILSSVVGKIRPDYRILTTFLLALIPSLRDSFLPVDNLGKDEAKRNVKALRRAMEHIAAGGPLGLFPAGEVATYQKKDRRTAVGDKKVIEDKPWAENLIKLIRKSGLPVVPIYFEGQNSDNFHRLGKIHRRLRTVRLIHELFNKQGTVVQVRIGQPITPEEIAQYDVPALGKYLRSRTYALQAQCLEDAPEAAAPQWDEPVAEPTDPALVRAEIARIEDRKLFDMGEYSCYLTGSGDIPATMREIARLREETFRGVGEGTGKALDTDVYDTYFHQMILWNVPNAEIVGAYRIGVGPEMLRDHGGVQGFYTASEFRYAPGVEPLLGKCIELGRSFIIAKYQREVLPLKMLFAGLAVVAYRYPDLEYFLGPVSISDRVPDFYKSLMVYYLEHAFPYADDGKVASAPNPFVPDYLAVNPADLMAHHMDSLESFDRLLSAISDGKYRFPVLVRQYFKFNAKLLCMNVDPLFADSLDALILLRFTDYPENTLRTIVRSLPPELRDAIMARFGYAPSA